MNEISQDMLYDFILDDPHLELRLTRLKDYVFAKLMLRKNISVQTTTVYTDDIERTVEFKINLNVEYEIKQSISSLVTDAVPRYEEYQSPILDFDEEDHEMLINEIYNDIFEEICNTMYYRKVEGIEV